MPKCLSYKVDFRYYEISMPKYELIFRKLLTKFGQLPLILVPMFLVAWYMYMIVGDYMLPLTIFILLWSTLFTSYALGTIVKLLYYKPRPEPRNATNRLQKIDASSFPSIHTANSMILAFWWILSILQTWYSGIGSYIFICIWFFFFMTVSLSRVVLKRHFPIDIVAWVVFWTICISIVMINTDIILSVSDYILTRIISMVL